MTSTTSKARLSVSSWSLNKSLGSPAFYGVAAHLPKESHNQGTLSLLELPQAIADFGINTLEITHFHLPSLEDAYLNELKAALKAAKVELFSFLIDDGDITHPEHGKRDQAWIASQLDIAAKLGSKCARVIAGKQEPTPENLKLSISRLKELASKAESLNLRLMIENWFQLASSPKALLSILEALNGRVGLCLDFGNWKGEEKYEQFKQIVNYAESCHTKAYFEDGNLNGEDYIKCLEITKAAKFSGPYTLIFESPSPSDWEGLALEKAIVSDYL